MESSAERYKRNAKLNMRKGWFAVLGCLFLDISLGEYNLLSQLYVYFASYFKEHNIHITNDNMKYIPMVWLTSQSIWGPIAIALYKHLGYKGSFTLYLVLFCSAQFIAS